MKDEKDLQRNDKTINNFEILKLSITEILTILRVMI